LHNDVGFSSFQDVALASTADRHPGNSAYGVVAFFAQLDPMLRRRISAIRQKMLQLANHVFDVHRFRKDRRCGQLV